MTSLHAAADSGNLEQIKESVREGCDINARDGRGWSALHYAIYSKQSDAVALLLSLGADPNTADDFGGIPLHWACEMGDMESTDHLLRNGADINRLDHKDRSALHEAVVKRQWLMVERLALDDADWLAGNPPHWIVFGGLAYDLEDRERVKSILEKASVTSPSAKHALEEITLES